MFKTKPKVKLGQMFGQMFGPPVSYTEAIKNVHRHIDKKQDRPDYVDFVTTTKLNPVTKQYEMKTTPKINKIKFIKYCGKKLINMLCKK